MEIIIANVQVYTKKTAINGNISLEFLHYL